MKTKKFIEVVYLNELPEMTLNRKNDPENPYDYLGFYLIAAGIEFLGACLDSYDWNKKGLSGIRFENALKKLFSNKKYTACALKIFEDLRCSILHSSKPGKTISLSKRKSNQNHLSEKNGKIILIYEDFLEDFLEACRRVIKKIENKELPETNKKVFKDILKIS